LLKKSGSTILASQQTRHQLSLDRAGLCGLEVCSDHFAYLCIHISETTLHQKECQLWINFTFDGKLQKPIAKMKPASFIA
jgi:hypothetical protein